MNKKLLTLVIMTIVSATAFSSCSSGTTEEDIVPPQQTQTPVMTPDEQPSETQEPPQTIRADSHRPS